MKHNLPETLISRFILLALLLTLTACGSSGHAISKPSHTLIATLQVKHPEPVLVDTSHHRLYAGSESLGTVSVFDTGTNKLLKAIHVGREVEDLALDSAAQRLYVASSKTSVATSISTATLTIAGRVRVGTTSGGVAIDPRFHRLYVANFGSNTVSVVGSRRVRLVRTLHLPGGPQGIAVDPGLHRMFVALQKRSSVVVFDESTLKRLATIHVGKQPLHPLRLDAAKHLLYVVNAQSSTLSVVDTRALRRLRTLKTGRNPEGLDITQTTAYVSNEGDPGTDRNSGHTISVIDLGTGRIVTTMNVRKGPDGTAYDPSTGRLYVASENTGTVSVISLPPGDR